MTVDEQLDYKCIVFHLNDEEYIIPVSSISSIERMLPITRVPSVAPFVKGVINLRGVIIPVIDVKERFFHQKTILNDQTRIIIVQLKEMSVGLIVESANDVVDIVSEKMEETPEVVGVQTNDYMKGVIQMDDHLYIALDLEKVLHKEGLNQLNALEG